MHIMSVDLASHTARRPLARRCLIGLFAALILTTPTAKNAYSELLPSDLFMARGYAQQFVAIIPSRKLVVVRLGATHEGQCRFPQFLADLLKAISSDGLS